MKTTKRWTAAAVLALTAGLAGKAWAINPDQITITITPSVNMNVAITTTTVEWFSGDTDLNLSMALGATDYFVRPATVTYTGTFGAAELNLRASLAGGWSIDADASTNEDDALQVYSLMSATGQSAAPALADYADGTGVTGDQIITTDRRYGLSGSDDGANDSQFQETSYSSASENLSNGEQRHMWLRLDAPANTTTTAAQTLTVVVEAVAAN
jgi:hypothetical protein